jgi:hypothetical protein
MSVKIRTGKGEVFDLPKDYVIEVTKTNPLFTNKGSQTVPISFPPTGKNRQLTEYAYRPDKAQRPSATIKVVVDNGTVRQRGLLAVQTASESLISANIGFDESEMYASMNKTLLPDLPELPSFFAGGADIESMRDAILTHLHDVMTAKIETDYAVFPVVLKKEFIEDKNMTYLEVINDTFVNTGEEFNTWNPSGGAIGGFRAKTNRVLQRVYDGDVIPFDVPKAYGVSPFIRVWKVLELIFKNYGFTLENNPFYGHEQLRRLVVLNNTMDAVLTGTLYYKDMMPDVTVEDFLGALWKKFGLLYFVDSNTRTVKFEFIRDILSSASGSMDVSKYKTAPVSITYKENRQLKLVPNNEIEGANVKYDTFEEFLAAYNHTFHESYLNVEFDIRYSLVYVAWLREYGAYNVGLGKFKYMSSEFFSWDKKDDLSYEEIKFNDLSLPLLNIESSVPAMSNYAPLLYLADYKHHYSDVTVSSKSVEKEQSSAKLAFAFSWGKSDLYNQSSPNYNYAFASQDNRDWNGHFINDTAGNRYPYSLTVQYKDGLFNRFWKEYDAWLRHSGHEVNVTLKMSDFELSKIKPYHLIIIDHQPCILDEIRYRMGESNKLAEMKLRTARLYEPYNLPEEQKIETYTDQKYYWRAESVKSFDQEAWLESQGIYYTIDGTRSMDTDARNSLLLLPPTEEQFNNQETMVYKYQYTVRWHQHGIDQSATVNQTTTFYPTLIT